MQNFVVNRSDVCAGMLLKTKDLSCKVIDINNKEISKEDIKKQGIPPVSCFGGTVCRGMLFKVNSDNLAHDLIYTAPTNYPIRGKIPKTNVESQFIIDFYVVLNELLKYLNYDSDLTQADLNQIYRKFIAHNWWLEHHLELFGWQKIGKGVYGNTGIETIPMEIYNNLSDISVSKKGKPYIEEPEYSLIKKRK